MTTPPPQDPFSQPSDPGPSQGAPPPYGSTPSYGAAPAYGSPAYGTPPPAGSSYGPPPSYGAPVQGYPPPGYGAGPPSTDPKAIIALVCAIGSFVVFPVVPAIIALVLASSSNREIEASGGRLTGSGLNTAAKVVAWINIALCVLGVVIAVAAVGLFLGA